MVAAHAQRDALLEACNSVTDKDKRLLCFKELSNLSATGASAPASTSRLKSAFAAISGTVNSGISYNNYKTLVVEPAKEVCIYKQENQNSSSDVLDLLDQAVTAYNDAEILWRASIYQSQDGEILFGKILNYERLGLTGIINKYNLPKTIVLLNAHVPIGTALPQIWQYEDEKYNLAIEKIEN